MEGEERTLVEIKNPKEFEAWAEKKPAEVALAVATRAALRVLPIAWTAHRGDYIDLISDLILPIFRATSAAWTAAEYPAHSTAASAWQVANNAATFAAHAAADVADDADAAAEAASAAFTAAGAPTDAVAAAAEAAAAFVLDAAFWSAISIDATSMDEGTMASITTGSPLWPEGQPDDLGSLWRDLKTTLQAAGQDWDVWTTWYDRRLGGRFRSDARELAYARIEDALWDKGPAAVNAEIKRRSKRRRRPRPDAKPTTEPAPPAAPLPPASPATRFIVQQGVVDVVSPSAWAGREAQFSAYHARARTIALGLADRLGSTDAAPEVAGSVSALLDVLGESATDVQPDQLRLASRTIIAKARAYAHPSAQWELSAESVSSMLELADLLVDLQAFAIPELEKHERAIRALDLTDAMAVEAKETLDLISGAIAAAPEIVSDRVLVAFNASSTASANAADKAVQLTIEGDRILLAENVALALARYLASPADQDSTPLPLAIVRGDFESEEHSDVQPHKQPDANRKSRAKAAARKVPSEDFVGRIIARLDKKGPDAIADALLSAVTSTIKHSPKSIPGLAALFYANFIGSQVLLATGGAFSLTLAWIAYELWKRKK
ncbi:hypothetical protein RZS28_06560 [Methylocapsa polymorpha]|uniref:Uncharacterized protein n=1 Tax=Methylocapsa polymorpha TaxID=3080828 RepID=A0ABZ0HUQ3_9HYPH|nr:hypothetical protein RZS28_06560 [Methylocapsa sp. RX1]